MTPDQIIAAITSALQTTDANGELANVMLVMQDILIKSLPNLSQDQITNMCTVLNINTSGS